MCYKRCLTFKTLLIIVLSWSTVSCDTGEEGQTQEEVADVSIRIPWIRTAATAGLEVADDKGFFETDGLKVEINPGSAEASPLRKVLTSEDQFGLLEPAQVINGIVSQDMPLTILALKAQKSPFCLMSRKEKNIKEMKDLIGHRVGYNPLNDISYRAMLSSAGIDRSQLNEVRVQFNLEPFLQDRVEVWPSYISNEPVAARSKGLEVSLICADDIGVKLYEHALFARSDFVDKNPEVVKSFLSAWVKGWRYALENRTEAVDIVIERTEGLEEAHERKVLEIFAELVSSGKAAENGFGWVEPAMIQNVGEILLGLGIIEKLPDSNAMVDNSYLKQVNTSLPE